MESIPLPSGGSSGLKRVNARGARPPGVSRSPPETCSCFRYKKTLKKIGVRPRKAKPRKTGVRPRFSIHQMVGDGVVHELRIRLHVHLAEDSGAVRRDGIGAEEQLVGDL